ncbi:MAG: carbohydrate ABC transporter permease [Candidatus Enteromonas sp.]
MDIRLSAMIIFFAMLAGFGVAILIDFLKSRKSHEPYRMKGSFVALGLLLPSLALAFFFVVLPIVYSLSYSFMRYRLSKPDSIVWSGMANFQALWRDLTNTDSMLFAALKNTGIFVVLVVPLQILLALGLALFTNNKRRGTTIFKVCFFTPVVISLTVSAYLWNVILSPSESGMMNSIFAMLGIGPQEFLNDHDTAMLWIVLMSAWQGCGYQMLIFSSALSGARKDLYEAASLDGANVWNRFRYVTLPALRPTLLYVTVTVFIGACRVMIQPMLMIGYQKWGVTLSYYMYNLGYGIGNVGQSCALGFLMTIAIGLIAFGQRKLMGEKK